MIDYSSIQQTPFSFLSKGTAINGKISLDGPTRLSSHIDGEIHCKGQMQLVIEIEGRVKGTIQCHDLDVYGQVDGTIISNGKVTLYPTAKILGQIEARSLVIHPGASVEMTGHTKEL